MTATIAPGARGPRAGARRGLIRRLAVAVVLMAALAVAWGWVHHEMPGWYARLWYPLEYEATIRHNADRYRLDGALVAGVIDSESGWVHDSTSSAGAVGLMQLLPATARFIAEQPTRPSPSPERLMEPEVNIAYGTWYLRYLIDRHDGSLPVALAAYNAGEGVVAGWERTAAAEGHAFRVPQDVPFPETRAFVEHVLDSAAIYRRAYGDRLGAPVTGLAVARDGSRGGLGR